MHLEAVRLFVVPTLVADSLEIEGEQLFRSGTWPAWSLLEELGRSWPQLIYATLFGALVIGALSTLRFTALERLVDSAMADSDTCALYFVATVSAWTGTYAAQYLGMRLIYAREHEATVVLMQKPLRELVDKRHAGVDGGHAAYLLRSGPKLAGRSVRLVLTCLQTFVTIALTALGAFWIHPVLGTVVVLGCVTAWGSGALMTQQRMQAAARVWASEGELHRQLLASLTRLDETAIEAAQGHWLSRFRRALGQRAAARRAQQQHEASGKLVCALLGTGVFFCVVGAGSYLAAHNACSVSQLASLLVLHQTLLGNTVGLLEQWTLAQATAGLWLLQAHPSPPANRPGVKPPRPIRSIVCRDLVWRPVNGWPGGPLTITLEPGCVHWLYASSAELGSALLHTIAGLLPIQHGQVELNGLDVRDWPEEELAQAVMLLGWPPIVVPGSLRDNLLLGTAAPVNDSQLLAALERVNLLRDLPCTHPTLELPLGQGQVELSIGQVQRLALARALIRQPDVLLLDNMLSGLDAACLRSVMETLGAYARGHLVLLAGTDPRLALGAPRRYDLSRPCTECLSAGISHREQ